MSNAVGNIKNLDAYLQIFMESGGTDSDYLKAHYQRFLNTYQKFTSTWDRNRGLSLVDVGAHWLHQSLFFALDGYQVKAIDLPLTFDLPNVQKLAETYDIDLRATWDITTGECFDHIDDNSVDVFLFTEILEHITFNPVEFWKAVFRIMKPGGRIVVTTPNYYSAIGRAWDFKRFRSGMGGGLVVDDILNQNTYGHHWKEFSMKEVIKYFVLLSPDFNCVKHDYTDDRQDHEKQGSALREWLMRRFDSLKPGLHIEMEVTGEEYGIVVNPGW